MQDDRTEKAQGTDRDSKPCKNMHEGVEVWEDTCVCEPEPRWRALAEELEESDKARQAPAVQKRASGD